MLPESPPCSLPLALTQAHRIGLENHGAFCLVYDLHVLKMKRKNKSGCLCEYQSLVFEYLKPQKSDWKGSSREEKPVVGPLPPPPKQNYDERKGGLARGRGKAGA